MTRTHISPKYAKNGGSKSVFFKQNSESCKCFFNRFLYYIGVSKTQVSCVQKINQDDDENL
jgi:hypothetical protein